MKKILIILGGGRANGNTYHLVKSFSAGLKDAGNTVELFSLNKNKINGCLGCNACRFNKPCIQKDNFNELAQKIKTADCIVRFGFTIIFLDNFFKNQSSDRTFLLSS